jgi:tRNA (cmo5U34)-methyltransferase
MAVKSGAKGKLEIPREWTFRSKGVAERFDSHVREQLPWYSLATGIVAEIARAYVPMDGVVIDVGASTGNVGRALAPMLTARHARLFPFDSAIEMSAVYDAPGQFENCDAVDYDYAARDPDLIVCFLSLMFVAVGDRRNLIEKMKDALRPGGAIVVFDKMVPRPGYAGTVAYRLTLAAKRDAGASPAEIVAKELSISGVQRPMSDGELSGFLEVFRFGDFAGWVHERSA